MRLMYIGKQIEILRKQRKISRNALSAGLCSAQTLLNIENGNCIPDKLLTDILLQRLGKCPDKLEMIISIKAYHNEKMFDIFEELLEKGKGKKAEQLLEQYYQKYGAKNAVQKMYYCRSKAYYYFRIFHSEEDALKWIEEALTITIPGWEEQKLDTYIISSTEMENLLAHGRLKLEQLEKQRKTNDMLLCQSRILNEITVFLTQCNKYIDQHIHDGEEHAKIYSKCAWLLARCNIIKGKLDVAVKICEAASMKLREYGISYFLMPHLQILVQYGERYIAKDIYKEYSEYLRVLKELYHEYNEDWHFYESLFHNCCNKAYYLDYELIRGERLAHGYTQEQLSEGIYEAPETLSRIECGKEIASKEQFSMLMERLGIQKERYNCFGITASFEMLELYQQIAILMNRRYYDEAEELINRLEQSIDLSIIGNIKSLDKLKLYIKLGKKSISEYEIIKRTMGILQQTYHTEGEIFYRAPMAEEAELLNQITIMKKRTEEKEETEKIYIKSLASIKQSRLPMKYYYRTCGILVSNYAKMTNEKDLARKMIKCTLACGKLNQIYINHMTVLCAEMDECKEISECKKAAHNNLYLCKLSLHESDLPVLRKWYKNQFYEDIDCL